MSFVLLLFVKFLSVGKPVTIPAIREWTDDNGHYFFNSQVRIVFNKNYPSLQQIAGTFRSDLLILKGIDALITDGNPAPGDIFLTLGSTDSQLGREGYSLTISDKIVIKSINEPGVFYGTRTILQLLKQSDSIPCGTARDFPDYRERGLMIDNGRKYFSVEWLEKHIKELAYIKLNLFHLHISEFDAFRLECESHPQITSKEHYKKSEIRALQELAAKYFVTIVPEIDMPNHMSAILKHFPDIIFSDTSGNEIGDCCLDVSSDKARSLVQDLLEEYLELFKGPYWHLGTDEFISNYGIFPQFKQYAQKKYGPEACGKDAFIDFINWVDSIVIAHNKKLRIWNDFLNETYDGCHILTINKDIIIEYWQGNINPNKLIDTGYYLMNCNWERLYTIIGEGTLSANYYLFNIWRPHIFQGEILVPEKHPRNLGSKFHVWCDIANAETEFQVANDIKITLRLLAQVNWDATGMDSTFSGFKNSSGLIGLAPGVTYPVNPLPNDLAFGKKVVASSVEPKTDYFPEFAVDGDYNSRWASDYHDSEWIYVDLGQKYGFTRVKLRWEKAFADMYEIQTSDDAKKWKTILTRVNGDGIVDDYTDLKGSGRYVRIFCNKRKLPFGFSLWELEIYDSTSIKTDVASHIIPEVNSYLHCYPNPSSYGIIIDYYVPEKNHVSLKITDIYGKLVANLSEEVKSPGLHQFIWQRPEISNGVYYCVLNFGNQIYSRKLMLIK